MTKRLSLYVFIEYPSHISILTISSLLSVTPLPIFACSRLHSPKPFYIKSMVLIAITNFYSIFIMNY